MRLLPKAVATLVTTDPDLTRVRDGLTAVVQPTLNFLNTYFRAASDGSLQVLRNVTALGKLLINGDVSALGAMNVSGNLGVGGNASVTGTSKFAGAASLGATLTVAETSSFTGAAAFNDAVTIAGTTTTNGSLAARSGASIYGSCAVFGSGANSLAIIPGAAGVAFYVASVGNTGVRLTINDSGSLNTIGTVSAANLVSGVGIPDTLFCGHYWNSAAAANTMYQTQQACQNLAMLGGSGATAFRWKWDRAGSIVGYSYTNNGPVAGQNMISYYKNGALVVKFNVGAGGNGADFWGVHAKGLYSYAAGDTLAVYVGNATAGNLQAVVTLSIERTA